MKDQIAATAAVDCPEVSEISRGMERLSNAISKAGEMRVHVEDRLVSVLRVEPECEERITGETEELVPLAIALKDLERKVHYISERYASILERLAL